MPPSTAAALLSEVAGYYGDKLARYGETPRGVDCHASHVVISGGVEIGEQCFLGLNATLRDHIKIGDKCVIGARALLLPDAESEGVYMAPATERSNVTIPPLRKI